MNRRERFDAVVRGAPTDRPPVSVWLHFASEHLTPAEVAELHLRYQRTYDWDVIKVMNDYRLPLCGGDAPASAADLRAVTELPRDTPALTKQLEVIGRIRDAVGDDIPVIDTLFDPLQTLLRSTGRSVLELVRAEPEAAESALRAVRATLTGYLDGLKEAGADGVFYSINWAVAPSHGGLEPGEFEALAAPFDRSLLEAAEGMVRVAHVHGLGLDFERVLDYPVEAYNWSHPRSAPSLARARQLTDRALIGGIDEAAFAGQSTAQAGQAIRRALAEAGRAGLMIGPGCTVPPDTPSRLLRHVRQTVEELT